MPSVITANLLRDGMVVYLCRDGWSRHLEDARVAETDEEIKALDAHGARDEAGQIVVGPYTFEVTLENGVPVARSVRETIRAAHRPTIIEGTDVPLR